MSAYRYVVFPRGKQPTTAEVAQLQTCAAALGGRFAWGTCRHEPRLAVAFEGPTFDHVLASDAGFEQLISKWKSRGSELVDHLGFVKDAAALKPAPVVAAAAHDGRADIHSVRNDERIAGKELAAKEAVAQSLLNLNRTLERYGVIQRVAAAVPYLLIAAAAMLTIAVGLYARDRLQNSGREPRQQTIERLATEPDSPPMSPQR